MNVTFEKDSYGSFSFGQYMSGDIIKGGRKERIVMNVDRMEILISTLVTI